MIFKCNSFPPLSSVLEIFNLSLKNFFFKSILTGNYIHNFIMKLFENIKFKFISTHH